MTELLVAALAPVSICAFYIFIRDKYEKEPVRLLAVGVVFGMYSTAVIWALGNFIELVFPHEQDTAVAAIFNSFISSSFVEEGVKYIFLFFLIWRNKNLNEWFDGMVYAVFISLGFAAVENIIYVLSSRFGGISTAVSRAIFSVPGHGLFGIIMGFHLSLAKFQSEGRGFNLFMAFAAPFLIHALYNLILFSGKGNYMLLLAPYLAALWYTAFKRMRIFIENSPFK